MRDGRFRRVERAFLSCKWVPIEAKSAMIREKAVRFGGFVKIIGVADSAAGLKVPINGTKGTHLQDEALNHINYYAFKYPFTG